MQGSYCGHDEIQGFYLILIKSRHYCVCFFQILDYPLSAEKSKYKCVENIRLVGIWHEMDVLPKSVWYTLRNSSYIQGHIHFVYIVNSYRSKARGVCRLQYGTKETINHKGYRGTLKVFYAYIQRALCP
jgi:hypothetical protein